MEYRRTVMILSGIGLAFAVTMFTLELINLIKIVSAPTPPKLAPITYTQPAPAQAVETSPKTKTKAKARKPKPKKSKSPTEYMRAVPSLGYSCTTVRWAIRTFDSAQLEAMAKTQGITPQQRQQAARCFR